MGGESFNNLAYYEQMPYRKFLKLLGVYNAIALEKQQAIEEANRRAED